MKRERVSEYALMLLGPVRFADKETRSQTIHTLHAMLDEEFNLQRKSAVHRAHPDETTDAFRIAESQSFDAIALAKADYLAPWKKKLVRLLGL